MKTGPSIAQVKQRHKFMLTGTLASMESRLTQIIESSTIPRGKFRTSLVNARKSIIKAREELRKTVIIV